MKPLTARRVTYGVFVLFVAVASSLVGSIIGNALEEDPFNPLGEYPVQSVDEVTATEITTTGTKCVNARESVTVVGEFNWFRIEPPGFATVPVIGQYDAASGCTTRTFTNTIPPRVLEVNRPGDVWFLTGTEWPLDSEGNRGVPRSWRSENFSIPTEVSP